MPVKQKKVKKLSELEETFNMQVKALGLPPAVREHRFHPIRQWRFDFCWPAFKVAVECEGGTWTQGRHTRGSGYEADQEKYNEAVIHGWRVLKFTSGQIKKGNAIKLTKRLLFTVAQETEGAL